MPQIVPQEKLGTLATRYPGASRVFQRYHLDFCCGGNQTLESACEGAGLSSTAVVQEIESELARSLPSDVRWDRAPLSALVDHIIAHYHAPLRAELDRLVEMAEKVARVHHEKDPERLPALARLVREIRAELLPHLDKEEAILFPWIKAGNGRSAAAPVSVMQREHEGHAAQLRALHELTSGFTPPPGACRTWRALYLGLAELDAELKEHIHLENNVLFPRALCE